MQKRILIYIALVLILSSCSIFRKRQSEVVVREEGIHESASLIGEMQENNLCRNSFIIKKGSIKIISRSFDGDFDIIGKVKNTREFYFSIRGLLGIEVMRIISDNDSLYIINRIERRVYTAEINEYTERIGLPVNIIGSVFGDLPEGKDGFLFERNKEGLQLNYSDEKCESVFWLCEGEKKICSSMIRLRNSYNFYDIGYSDFQRNNSLLYPKRIEISNSGSNFKAEVTIDELEVTTIKEIPLLLPGYKRNKL